MKFLNRTNEFNIMDSGLKKGGLYVIYGRRRIGKSRFLREFTEKNEKIIYYQAVQTAAAQQIQDLWLTISPVSEITVNDWKTFFSLLSDLILQKKIKGLILDEFPFIVESGAECTSVFQKWIDQFLDQHSFLLVCSGSSQRMMHSLFLNGSAPLYGRAAKIFKMQYLDYNYYLTYLDQKNSIENFECFSMMGGVPRYWLLSEKETEVLQLADKLYFSDQALLSEEPTRLISDEGITGRQPFLILDLIGRGAHKPSEIANHLMQSQGSLGKPMSQLMDIDVIRKEIPFGKKPSVGKKVHLMIQDPSLSFWYNVVVPNTNSWKSLTAVQKKNKIKIQASKIFESYVRLKINGQRFWDKNIEIDAIVDLGSKKVKVVEIKFTVLSEIEKKQILSNLQKKWESSEVSKKYIAIEYEVIDIGFLDK